MGKEQDKACYMGNKNLPTRDSQQEYTPERVKELKLCAKSILHFAENYFFIIDLDHGKTIIKLRKYQKRILKSMKDNRLNIVLSSRQQGKALALDTPIPTPTGWTTMGQLKDGDIIYDEHYAETKVIKAHDILYGKKTYEVVFNNGTTVIACDEHLWYTETADDAENKRIALKNGTSFGSIKTTQQIADTLYCAGRAPNHRIPAASAQDNNTTEYHYITEVRKVESVPVRCITVDSPNNLYLCTSSFIPTHNTTLLTIFALWQLCFNEDQRILLIANKEVTAINVFKRIRMAYEMCPNWLKPGVVEYAKTGMSLANGSSISVSTTSADSARGESCNVLMIDEAAFIDQTIIEEFWASVMPVITQGNRSKVIIASTPNGTDNKFYEIWNGAVNGDNEWTPVKTDWWEIEGRDEAWKQKMVRTLGSEEMFNQEYGNVFTQKGESGFDPILIQDLKAAAIPPKWQYDGGCYRLWEKPLPERVYTIGVDVSEGIGRAASVVNVVDITDLTKMKLVAQYHNRDINTAKFAKKIVEIATQWGSPALLVERNNCGMAVIDALVNTHDYSNIVTFIPKAGQNGENFKNSGRIGIFSHTNTKFTGINNLRYWVEELRSVEIPDIETIKEMETFIRHPNGVWKKRAGKDVWDDRVDALIWTLLVLEPSVAAGYYDIEAYDEQGRPAIVRPSAETTPVIDPDSVYHGSTTYNPKMPTNVLPTYVKPNQDAEEHTFWDDAAEGAWFSAEDYFSRS